jgi:hypothetical protein
MWPFRKKINLLGFKKDKEGNLTFDLTEEEQQEVENTFKIFEGYYVHPDYVDDIQKGTTALALSNYAKEQVVISQMESQKENRKRLLEKAISATTKAYSIYPLPIYLYDLACFLEMVGKTVESKHAFRDFLKKQSEFKFKQLDVLFLKYRDIDEAIEDAKIKVKKLTKGR